MISDSRKPKGTSGRIMNHAAEYRGIRFHSPESVAPGTRHSRATRNASEACVLLTLIIMALWAFPTDAQASLQVVPPVITTGAYPTSMSLSTDGSRLYVVNANPYSSPRRGDLMTFDTATGALIGSPILLGSGGTEKLAVTADGGWAYVAVDNRIDAVNLSTQVITPITTGGYFQNASDVILSPDQSRLYVSNRTDDTVSVIDIVPTSPTYHQVIASVAVGSYNTFQPYGMIITSDGSRLYVASEPTRTVSVIQTATNTVTSIPVSGVGSTVSGNYSQGVAVSQDGTRIYVTYNNHIVVIDSDPSSATYNQQIDTITPGVGTLSDVVVVGDGSSILVTETGPASLLLQIDVTSKAILGSVSITNPDQIVYRGQPDAYAYVIRGGMDPGGISVIGTSASAQPVPEPFSSTLMALGLSAWWLRRRFHGRN